MKTIEEFAFNRYLSDQSLPVRQRIDASNYLDWANLGAKEAQRWIPIEEELPEDSMPTMVDGMYQETKQVLYKTSNGKYGITSRVRFMDHGFYWKGSGTLQKSIINWRPIERN